MPLVPLFTAAKSSWIDANKTVVFCEKPTYMSVGDGPKNCSVPSFGVNEAIV